MVAAEEVEHDHHPSVHTEQVDFVATALLALRRGSSSTLTLCSSSSLASLNSNNGTSKERAPDDYSVDTRQDMMGVPAAMTKAAKALSTTQEPSSLPLQPSSVAASSSSSSTHPTSDDHHVDNKLPEDDLVNVSPRRLYEAKFIHPASCTQEHMTKKNQQQIISQQRRQIQTIKKYLPTPPPPPHSSSSSLPIANFDYYNNNNGNGIIQHRWSNNMKNINKNMEMRHKNYQQHPSSSIIVVPPVRPIMQHHHHHHRLPVVVPPPRREIPFRNIAYSSSACDYDANVLPRRVSDATTTPAGGTTPHSRVINLTTSNDDYHHGGSNENSKSSANDMQNNLDPPLISRQIHSESGGGLVGGSSSRNGGPLSQIYNEHRKQGGFYPPFCHSERTQQQQQQVANQPITTTTTSTHYGSSSSSTPHAAAAKFHTTKQHRTAPARLPKHITEYLKYWMSTHMAYPYPSEREKQIMMYHTGIDRKRLDVWLRNNRNRYVNNNKVQQKKSSSFHPYH